MKHRSKLVYFVGSAVIGIIVVICILVGLIVGGVLDVGVNKLVFASASKSSMYNGEVLTCAEWTLVDGKLEEGHTAKVTVTGQRTDAGRTENTFTVSILDEDGVDVSGYYEIEKQVGELFVQPIPIIVKSENISTMYSGAPMFGDASKCSVTEELLLEGHTYEYVLTGSQTDVGKSVHTVAIRIYDEDAKDVTHNYSVDYDLGELIVSKRPIYIMSNGHTKEYDGSPCTADGYTISNIYPLPEGYEEEVEVIGSLPVVGEADNTIGAVKILKDGVDVTYNFDVQKFPGKLVVTGEPTGTFTEANKGGDINSGNNFLNGFMDAIKDIAQDLDGDGLFDDFDGDGTGDDLNGDGILGDLTDKLKQDLDGDGVWDDFNGDGNADDLNMDGIPGDLSNGLGLDLDGDGFIDDFNFDGVGDDLDMDGIIGETTGDIYQDLDGDGVIDDFNGDGKGDDLNGDGIDGDKSSQLGFDLDGDGFLDDFDFDKVGDDLNGDGVVGDLTGDIYQDLDGDGVIDDFNGDGKGDDLNGDGIDGDKSNDLGFDLDGDGFLDDLNKDGIGDDLNGDGLIGDLTKQQGLENYLGLGAPLAIGAMEITIAKVTASETGRMFLRIKSDGNYTGRGWTAAEEYQGDLLDDTYGMNYLTGKVLENANYVEQSMDITSLYDVGYMLPYYMDASSYVYNIQTGDAYNVGVAEGMTYSVRYYMYSHDKSAERITSSWMPDKYKQIENDYYEKHVTKNYLDVPPKTLEYINTIIEKQGWTAETNAIASKVAKYVQNAAEYSLLYNRAMDKEEDVVVAFLRDYKEGICQHYAAAATLIYRALGIPARYTEGYVVDAVANESVDVKIKHGHAWTEIYVKGVGWIAMEVTGGSSVGNNGMTDSMPINPPVSDKEDVYSVSLLKVSKKYDGTPLFATNRLNMSANLKKLINENGYSPEVIVSGSRTEVGLGKGEAKIESFILRDKDGNDITDQYKIDVAGGDIHIYRYDLTISSETIEKTYDKTPLTNDDTPYVLTVDEGGGEAAGHTISVTFNGSQTNVGQSSNRFAVKIVDADGKDVSVEYNIRAEGGQLRVNPRTLKVESGSAEQAYDGTPLTCETWSILEDCDGLAEGHYINAIFDKEAILVDQGDTLNTFTVKVYDKNGNDVTSCYSVDTIPGILIVY